ncbi:MAG: hypothetical protein L0H73_02960, partial [Nitrococcus sp.]|nr:hypothetical protein [Nitrococcus sp.]
QLDPIWVYFNVSERDVLRIKQSLRRRGITYTETPPVMVEVGLPSETGYPHQGKLDYIAPQIDTGTGTLSARAVLDNADRACSCACALRSASAARLCSFPRRRLAPSRAAMTS